MWGGRFFSQIPESNMDLCHNMHVATFVLDGAGVRFADGFLEVRVGSLEGVGLCGVGVVVVVLLFHIYRH